MEEFILVLVGSFGKKAPLGAHEIYTKFTGKMESEGKPILAHHAHFCPGEASAEGYVAFY